MEIKVLAPAKINLTLDVTGKRPDGYHNILSIIKVLIYMTQLPLPIMTAVRLPFRVIMRASLVMKKIFVTKRRKDFLLLPVTKDRAYI